MSAERVPFSCGRTSLIAGNTFLEAVRQRLFLFLVLLAVALVTGARFFQSFDFGPDLGVASLKFTFDFGLGALVFFGSTLTITATAQLFFSEIENRTALTLLAKQQATVLHNQGSAILGVKQIALEAKSDISECRLMFAQIMNLKNSVSSSKQWASGSAK